MKLKTLSILLTILLVCQLNLVVLVHAQSTTFTISQGVYPATPSFTIWLEGSTYYAKNKYGYIAYQGTNRTTVINSATLETDGEFLLLTGTYSGKGTILLDAGDHLIGQGIGNTIIYLADGSNSEVIKNRNQDATGDINIAVKNLEINGNNAGQTFGTGYYGTGIKFVNVDNSIIEDVYIHDCWNAGIYWFSGGVSGVRNSDNILSRVHIDTMYATAGGSSLGCCTLGKWDNGTVTNSIFENALEYGGLTADEGRNILFEGNIFRFNVRAGLILEGTASESKDACHRVIENLLINNLPTAGHGISIIEGLRGITIQNNVVAWNAHHGIYLQGLENTVVDANIVFNNDQNNNDASGIIFNEWYGDYCSNNTISNNQIFDNQTSKTQDYGIRILKTTYINILGNQIIRMKQRGIWLESPSSENETRATIIGNTILDTKVASSIRCDYGGNIIMGNRISGSSYGVALQSSKENILVANDLRGNTLAYGGEDATDIIANNNT